MPDRRRGRTVTYIFALLAAVGLVAADQLTKYFIVTHFAVGETLPVIEGVFHITYVQNRGAAFGIFQDQPWIFLSITAVILLVCVSLLIKKTFKSRIMHWALFLVLAGGVGNMIDRLFRTDSFGRHYVVDFLDARFIDFPVFNIADICVVVGAGLIILYFVIDTIKDVKRHRRAKAPVLQGEDACEKKS